MHRKKILKADFQVLVIKQALALNLKVNLKLVSMLMLIPSKQVLDSMPTAITQEADLDLILTLKMLEVELLLELKFPIVKFQILKEGVLFVSMDFSQKIINVKKFQNFAMVITFKQANALAVNMV